jgi:hypothetical protein
MLIRVLATESVLPVNQGVQKGFPQTFLGIIPGIGSVQALYLRTGVVIHVDKGIDLV